MIPNKIKLPIRLAMLASRGGTTALAIYNACQPGGRLYGYVKPVCLVVSDPKAAAKEKLFAAGMSWEHLYDCIRSNYPNREGFGEALLQIFRQERIDIFGQYGWMPLTPANVIAMYPGINQHPALVPYIGGKGMYGIWPHEVMIRFTKQTRHRTLTYAVAQIVDKEYDKGRIIKCLPLCVDGRYTAKTLQSRLLPLEHKTQIDALQIVARALSEGRPIPTFEMPDVFNSDELVILDQIKHEVLAAQNQEQGE